TCLRTHCRRMGTAWRDADRSSARHCGSGPPGAVRSMAERRAEIAARASARRGGAARAAKAPSNLGVEAEHRDAVGGAYVDLAIHDRRRDELVAVAEVVAP